MLAVVIRDAEKVLGLSSYLRLAKTRLDRRLSNCHVWEHNAIGHKFGGQTAVGQHHVLARGCSSCHGLNAEGAGIAPSLIGVGAASVDFQVATGRMPMADMSQQAMRKEPVYDEEETAALAAYVASLAPGPAAITNEELAWERSGDTAEGGELFRNNCAMCHNFAGQGGALTQGKYAPTVMGVEPKHIYEAMLTGPQAMPVFSDNVITPEEKLSIIKWIKHAESEPALGGAALGRVGPVTEGLLAWTLGLGLLIGVAVWLTTKAR